MANKTPIRWIEGTLYIRMDALVEMGISFDTIKMGYDRNTHHWQKINDPEDRRSVLIAYEPMKEQYKDLVRAEYGEPAAYMAVVQHISHHPPSDIVRFYANQLLHRSESERTSVAIGYAVVAMVLERCNQLKPSACKLLGFKNKAALLDAVLIVLRQEKQRLPVKIGSLQVLRRKMSAYKKASKKGQENALMSIMVEGKKAKNSNAAKMGQEQLQYLVALMGHWQKPSISVVCRLFHEEARKRDWAFVSQRTIRRYLEKPTIKQQWFLARHGKDANYQAFDPSAKRYAPSRSHALWVMDGTPLDLYYQERTERYDEQLGKWVSKTTYYNRAYLYLIIDATSWAILGYVIDDTENHTAVVGALRNAVKNTGLLPKQIQRDGGSAGEKVKSILDKMAKYNIPSVPYSPKSKVIEAIIGHFQQEVLRYNDNWAGQNITAKGLDSRFNPDELAKNKKNFPSKAEMLDDVALMIETWNQRATKGRKAPRTILQQKQSAGRNYDVWEFMELFWVLSKKAYKYHQSGITITINKQEHTFATYQADLYIRLVHQKFQIKYDPQDMDYIYLYQNDKPVLNENGQHIILEKAHILPMAVDDYQEGDGAKIKEVVRLKKAVKEQAEQHFERIRTIQAEEGIKLGVRNVHKDAYNAAELALKRQRILDEDEVSYYDDPYAN